MLLLLLVMLVLRIGLGTRMGLVLPLVVPCPHSHGSRLHSRRRKKRRRLHGEIECLATHLLSLSLASSRSEPFQILKGIRSDYKSFGNLLSEKQEKGGGKTNEKKIEKLPATTLSRLDDSTRLRVFRSLFLSLSLFLSHTFFSFSSVF